MRKWPALFSDGDLWATLEGMQASITDRVDKLSPDRFEVETDEYLAALVASELVISPLELLEDQISLSDRETQVDISHDPNRHFSSPGPHYRTGVEVTYHLPFEGDSGLFKLKPNRFTSIWPRAFVEDDELRFPYDALPDKVADTKKWLERDLSSLRPWIGWVNEQVESYNESLQPKVLSAIRSRRNDLEVASSAISELGCPLKETAAAPTNSHKDELSEVPEVEVALSFAGEERPYVEKVATALRSAGVGVFYDDFAKPDLWGADLAAHFHEIYGRKAEFVVVFASRHYASKAWPSHELRAALERQLAGDFGRILPARFDDTRIPGLPSTIGHIDLRAVSPEQLAELILQKLGRA